MKIIDLKKEYKELIEQTAVILYESFKDISTAWSSMELARDEVYDSIGEDKISRIVVKDEQTVLGWIGGRSMYNGNVWELHPLVVKREYRGQGIGKLLVNDLEERVKERGGLTIWLGTDDEDNSTSLSNTDLYENLYEKIVNIKNLKRHPFEFYQKMGFVIVGVMPDANGIGKPDIYMAKKVRK
ncbi:MAG: GNAT family N-acetyltransferase [Firmicutes bacterium]|nr:GNAT family N-acetyltransferase [Bacillota bacterium]